MLTEDKGFIAITEQMSAALTILLAVDHEAAAELWNAADNLQFHGKEEEVKSVVLAKIWPDWRDWIMKGKEKRKNALDQRRYAGRKSAETRNGPGPGGQN